MIRTIFLAACLCVLSVLSMPVDALAQRIDKDYIKPMPEVELMPKAEFEQETILHEAKPTEDDYLEYSIRVPSDWQQGKTLGGIGGVTINTKIFQELLQLYSPPRVVGSRSMLTVKALELEYKLTAEQWLLKHLVSQGATIEGFVAHSDTHAEALKVIVDRSISYVVRSSVYMNGKRVVLVEYSSPVEFWKDEKVMQAQVVNSFTFKKKEERNAVEEMDSFTLLDLATVHYPSSWQLRMSNLLSIERLDAALLNLPVLVEGDDFESASLDGKIDFSLVSAYTAESLEAEIEIFNDNLKENGIEKGEEVEFKDDFTFHDAFEYARVNVYAASVDGDKANNYELWIAELSAEDYFYFITLLTPTRDDDFFLWSRNTQTFKQVLEELEPTLDSVIAQ